MTSLVVIVCCFSAMVEFTFGYYCQNKNLEIIGQTSSSESDLYSILNSYYFDFRKNQNFYSNVETQIGQTLDSNRTLFSTFPSPKIFSENTTIVTPLMAE